ncbi:MAG: coproporphyrinogen III oxidase family protein [Bacteroidales bacterium]|nr:coproporphyrinogen III oxidase family protein [Bacteroidales bacterium]
MVYVHVPFCGSFCVYCAFYSEIVGTPGYAGGDVVASCQASTGHPILSYIKDLCREAAGRRDEIAASSAVPTLYIGGGTPSLLSAADIKLIADAVGGGPWSEFTVEVNPEDIVSKGEAYVRELLEAGVNRISMGVQSLDDGVLRWMCRRHNAETARNAYSILRNAGVGNISIDIISGIGGFPDECLEKTVSEILTWQPEHISAYQLGVDEGSALEEIVDAGRWQEAPEEQCRSQYEFLCKTLGEAGYRHYEISNWALPGKESVHNSSYWKRVPYVGLGPGAHSFRILPDGTQLRSWNSRQTSGWSAESEILSPEEIREETLMLGLRTAEGVGGRKIPESDWFVADSIIASLL